MTVSDEQLIERYRADPASSEGRALADELLRRYSSRVFSWCWRFAGDREVAADLAQDVLLKAYQNLGAFRLDSKFSTWLYMIVRNHCLNHARGRKAEPLNLAEPLDHDPRDDREWDTLTALLRESDLREARRLVAEVLDETEAKVMLLHYGEEVPLNIVTRMLGLANASGAKASVVSAKRKLTAALQRVRSREMRRPPSRGEEEIREPYA